MDENSIHSYLSGRMSGETKHEFEEWLKASPENREYFEAYRSVWEIADNYKNDSQPDFNRNKEQFISRIRTVSLQGPKRRIIPPMVYRIAAGLILLIAMGTLLFNNTGQGKLSGNVSYASVEDSVQRIVLPDSSVVWLNKGAILTGPSKFGSGKRVVYLEGEAFFEIRRDVEHPFLVACSNSKVEVLGTSFNIVTGRDNEGTRVDVATGRVRFSKTGFTKHSCELIPGDRGILLKGMSRPVQSKQNGMNYLAWKTGWFRFQNTALRDVLDDLSAFYNCSFILDSSVDETLSLSGNFRTGSLEEIMEITSLSLGIDFNKIEKGIYRVINISQSN